VTHILYLSPSISHPILYSHLSLHPLICPVQRSISLHLSSTSHTSLLPFFTSGISDSASGSGSVSAASLAALFESFREESKTKKTNLETEKKGNQESGSSPLDWNIDLSNCLIIFPRNSWSKDAVAVAVGDGAVRGLYVPTSWAAPLESFSSESRKCLTFNPDLNIWYFDPESESSEENKSDSGSGPQGPSPQKPGTLDPIKEGSEGRKGHSGPRVSGVVSQASLKNIFERLNSGSSGALQISPSSSDEGDEKGDREDEGGKGEVDGEGEGEEDEWEGEKGEGSSKYSAVSAASSMYQSFDDLDADPGSTPSGGNPARLRNGGQLDWTGDRSPSGSTRSARSRVSFCDAEELFFDTYDDTLAPQHTSSREAGTDGGTAPGTEVRKAAVRFDIPPTPDSQSPAANGVISAVHTVSRIIVVLHKADLYVSLAGPLGGTGGAEEEAVTDELREYADVSHHGAVYKELEVERAKKRENSDRGKETGEGDIGPQLIQR
jgi:hypothetical protein